MLNKGKWVHLVAVAAATLTLTTGVQAEETNFKPVYGMENVKGTCYFSSRTCSGYSGKHIDRKSCDVDKGGMSWKPPKTNHCVAIRD